MRLFDTMDEKGCLPVEVKYGVILDRSSMCGRLESGLSTAK